VLFYGEEIGLGDDQSLEGRHAVRTAMQWSARPGGGFSRAPRPAMARPPIEGGPFGYERLNVDAQREDQGSLLSWMQRVIRRRREWPEIGWGEPRLLQTGDDAVLAHAMDWMGGTVVAVHNLADRSITVDLAMPRATQGDAGWEHLLGPASRRAAPAPDGDRLRLKLDPYAYHWFGRRERT
jgi:maltose alpha-D-glucosyltransferase/alpha-amylase